MSKSYVDAREFSRALDKLANTATAAADEAVQCVVQQKAFTMSFDDTESVPYEANAEGNIVIIVKDQATAEELVTVEANAAVQDMTALVTKKIGGALK